MRVLHVLKITGIAGAENHLLVLLHGLRQQGVDARFLLLVEPGNPVPAFADACDARGIPYEHLTIYHHADLTLFVRLFAAFRRLRPDIVHTHLLHADLYGIPAARAAGRRVVSSRHNDNRFRTRWVLRLVNRLLWSLLDAGIAISDAVRRFSVAVEGAPEARLHTIHYGCTPPAADREAARAVFNAVPDALVIGCVCRLVEQKGLPYAIAALARLADAFPQAVLLIIGDGPLRTELEAQARPLGERVCFFGWRPDAMTLMAGFDVFLMPSLWEGFGLVLLEAMAQQVPVVASRVSAIPEVVSEGETGLLVPPRDVAALSDALRRLLSDAGLRAQMGAAGRARLESHFTVDQMVRKTLAVYQALAPA